MKRSIAIAAALFGLLAGRALATVPEPHLAHADVSFGGVRFWHFKGNALTGVGTAQSLVYDRSASQGTAHQVQADLSGLRDDPRPVHLEAVVGHGNAQSRTVDGNSGVTARREDGTARSNSVHYDGPTQLATGNEAVNLESPRLRAQGQGFTLAANTGVVELGGPVDAHVEAQR